MGKLVNVVLPDGKVAAVSEEDAARLTGAGYAHTESTAEQAGRSRATTAEEEAAGLGSTVRAGLEGAADMLTGGGFGAAEQYIGGGEVTRESRQAAAAHPVARFLGETAALVAPSGLLGASAKAAGEASFVGGAARLGGALTEATGSRALGRLAEGAALGVGGTIAHTNVTGDPLSVEGLVEGASIGGVLNVGAGMLADKLTGMSKRAKEALNEAEQLSRDTEVATANAKHFESDAGVNTAYKQAATAVKVRQQAAAKAVRDWEKQSEAYDAFLGNNQRLTRSIEDAENTVRSVRQRYSVHAPGEGIDVKYVEGKPYGVHYKFDTEGVQTETLHPSKPPISEDLDARLKDYQTRISRLYQMKGGRTALSNNKWNTASGPANSEAVMGELRSVYSDLQRDFPKAAGKLKPLPDPLPPRPPEPANVELAPNFKAFTRQHPDTVARLANSMDDATKAEFQRLNVELGVDPAAGVADVHQSAREWLSAMDRVEAETAKRGAEGSKGFFEIARRFVRNTARFKAGFAAAHAIGGPIGSAVGVATSSITGTLVDSAYNALVGGALLTAKAGIRARIQSVVAKYGGKAAVDISALGPAASWLSTSHLTGRADPETEIRRRARNRVDELHGAVLTAPDTAYTAVEPLLGHPSDVAFKVYQQVTNAINHLAQTAPLDPGLDIKMFSSKWTPAWHESVALAHRLEAVHAPLNALARLLAGQGHAAAADTLWAVWPALMQEAAAQIVEKASQGEYDTRRASAFSRIFRIPLTGLQNPIMITALQGNYLPSPGPGGTSKPPQPTGRPPAVNSPIAGSNVGALIS